MAPAEVNDRVDEAQKKMEEAEKSLGEAYEKLTELMKSGVVLPGLSQFTSGVLSSQVELSAAINDMYMFRV